MANDEKKSLWDWIQGGSPIQYISLVYYIVGHGWGDQIVVKKEDIKW